MIFFKVKQLGFTLIELLIVIAVLGVLAGGILYLMDPVDRIKSANDVKVQNHISEIGRAADGFGVRNNGAYADSLEDLVSTGELKSNPEAPFGYTYSYNALNDSGGNCTTETEDCSILIITSPLKSRKHQATPYQRVEVHNSKICQVVSPTDACP